MRYFRFPQGLREFHLSQPDPAGPRHQDGRRILALAEAALHGHALLAAQRHLAGRIWSSLDHGGGWKALHYMAQALLLAGRGVRRSRRGIGTRGDRRGQRRPCRCDGRGRACAPSSRWADAGRCHRSRARSIAGPSRDDARPHRRSVRSAPDSFLFLDWQASDGIGRTQSFLAIAATRRIGSRPLKSGSTAERDGGAIRAVAHRPKPAFHVVIEATAGGHFSDNAFDILPGETSTITFTPDDPATAVDVAAFVVRDLHSSYASRST